MDELDGKVAVVTGAAGGIGVALCERFAAEGMRIVMADVDPERLEAAAAQIDAEVLAVTTDVSRYESVEALERQAVERFGAVHVLCNNAGVTLTGRTWRFSLEEWEWLLGVNLWGVIHGIKAFVPGMLERGEPAHVVNTASIAGLTGFPVISMYTTSKFAVVGLSESLEHDLRAKDAPVGVSVVCPGAIDTDLRRNSSARRPGAAQGTALAADPEEAVRAAPAVVADQVVDAIRNGRFWVLTHPAYNELLEQRLRGIVETGDAVAAEWL
jgi:NAD(P)-dependent dehydrogenase (short-subunit alcohol dehydrogenase family)